MTAHRPRQFALLEVPPRRCPLCNAPFGRPSPTCARCQLRSNPLPPAPPPTPREIAESAAAEEGAKARIQHLTALGRPVRVGLVGCSEKKLELPGLHPARLLYQGNFFRKALPIAERTCDETWILSARYGLVALDHELPYYQEELPTRHKERALWGRNVITSLANAYFTLPVHLVFLAGAPYVEGVTGFDSQTDTWREFNGFALRDMAWTWEHPLRGLDRPARYRWFAQHGGSAARRARTRAAAAALSGSTPTTKETPRCPS